MRTIERFPSEQDRLLHRITRHEKVRLPTSKARIFLIRYGCLILFLLFVIRQQIFLLGFDIINRLFPAPGLSFCDYRFHIRGLWQMFFAKYRAGNLFF